MLLKNISFRMFMKIVFLCNNKGLLQKFQKCNCKSYALLHLVYPAELNVTAPSYNGWRSEGGTNERAQEINNTSGLWGPISLKHSGVQQCGQKEKFVCDLR